ncbi:MAG: CHASE2 domain-containing protein [Oligoflexia bacterium]|nr:CHASE2 domain-containing protein [Oligoflexia bacterium]
MRIQWDLGIKYNDDIVIVTMDDESDSFLGEKFPYTYATHTRFMSELTKHSPAIINYIINFKMPDSEPEAVELQKLKKIIKDYTLLGGAFRFGTALIEGVGEEWPYEELREFGHSLALLHRDSILFAKDEICRRAILNISGDDSLHLWTANKFREQQGLSSNFANAYRGAYYSKEADATFALFRYYTSPLINNPKIKKIPYHRVVVGNIPPGFFEKKIVLVGAQYISRSNDFIATPFGRTQSQQSLTPKLNIHAEVIEALIQNKTASMLPRTVTDLLCFILALFLSYINSKVSPTRGLMIIFVTFLIIFFISFLAFSLFGTWIYVTHLILTIFIVYYIWVPFRAIAEYQTRYTMEEETKLLKQVDNLKQNFISLMSHDLKTPVAKIASNADILGNYFQMDEKQRVCIRNIIEATKELNNFITGILDFIKVEAQRFNLNSQSKDLNIVVDTVISNYKYEIQTKNVEIIKELSPLFPIKMDFELIKRVVSNLFENAIKYSSKDKRPSVELKTWDDDNWVYLSIKDNGVGISEEDLKHIFDKFYRVKNDASHSIKGFGLGLYLVKYFIELHGGNIEVNSKLGIGTIFLIKLKNE